MLEKYPEDVKVVFKNFPLTMHKFAKPAAKGALAAHKQGKFWEYHHKIFQNYKALNDDKLREFAEELNLDMDKFNKDINDAEIENLINRDVMDGMRVGVRGTPTIFVNGKLLKNRSLQGFQIMIDAELKKK